MSYKMREKYVDEAQPPLMIFGVRVNGNVDVADANRDVFTDIPRDVAERIVMANQKYMQELYEILT